MPFVHEHPQWPVTDLFASLVVVVGRPIGKHQLIVVLGEVVVAVCQ